MSAQQKLHTKAYWAITASILLALVLLVGCPNPAGGDSDSSGIIITFNAESTDGTILAQKPAIGLPISSGEKIADGVTLLFTTELKSGKTLDTWKINGRPQSRPYTYFTYTVRSADAVVENGEKVIKITASFRDAQKVTINFNVEGSGGTLTAKKNSSGTVTAISSGAEMDEGSNLMFSAKPDSGKTIDSWKINGAVRDNSDSYFPLFGSVSVFTYTPASADTQADKKTITITVSFRDAEKIAIKFNVEGSGGTLSAKKNSSGTVTAISSGDEIDEGAMLQCIARPDSGKTVADWKKNGTALSQPDPYFSYSVLAKDALLVDGKKTITITVSFRDAEKIAIKFNVEGSGGTIRAEKWISGTAATISSGDEIDEGAMLRCIASPDSGKIVADWKKNGTAVSLPDTYFSYRVEPQDALLVAGKKTITITVSFRDAEKIAIKFNVEGSGGTLRAEKRISGTATAISSGDEIDEGVLLQCILTPDSGKIVADWKMNGTALAKPGPYFIYNVLAKDALLVAGKKTITFTVSFRDAQKVTIIFNVEGSGGTLAAKKNISGTAISSGDEIDEDVELQCIASPDSGKTVAGWKMNGTALSKPDPYFSYRVEPQDALLVAGKKTITFTVSFRDVEKIAIKFNVEGSGGTLRAEKNSSGAAISSGDEIDEDVLLQFTASPDSGKRVADWKMNGTELSRPFSDFRYRVHSRDALLVAGKKTITITVSFKNNP